MAVGMRMKTYPRLKPPNGMAHYLLPSSPGTSRESEYVEL
jgi:hypothetical protein